MDIEYRNREPLEPELEEFTRQVAEDLEIGKRSSEFYNKNDYREGIEFLAKDVGLVE